MSDVQLTAPSNVVSLICNVGTAETRSLLNYLWFCNFEYQLRHDNIESGEDVSEKLDQNFIDWYRLNTKALYRELKRRADKGDALAKNYIDNGMYS